MQGAFLLLRADLCHLTAHLLMQEHTQTVPVDVNMAPGLPCAGRVLPWVKKKRLRGQRKWLCWMHWAYGERISTGIFPHPDQ